ncbi:hypothetical protein TrST_g9630 [Triparma strigata]|uniref:SAM domain-containing protein n=1 Tax=Triparma strigata TaxID=1606541 RepID=A0A9W6ZN50_9STRA|nr:hypothetical protein TrST_g9630 [Triparma strigata]
MAPLSGLVRPFALFSGFSSTAYISSLAWVLLLLLLPLNGFSFATAPNPAIYSVVPSLEAGTRHLADSDCKWNYLQAQCEPIDGASVCCEYRYQWPDMTFSQSCREKVCEAGTLSPTPAPGCGTSDPDDCCGWSFGTDSCVGSVPCSYQYRFGDLTLDQSCRVDPNADDGGDGGGDGGDSSSSSEGALATFLKKFTVAIPDPEPFVLPTGIGSLSTGTIKMTVTDLECKNIYLSTMTAAQEADGGMMYGISGVGATCSGNWAYEYGFMGDDGELNSMLSGQGYLTLVVADTGAGLKLTIQKDSNDYAAEKVTASQCSMDVNIVMLEFGGSLEAWIVDLFTGPIEIFVETSLGNVLCGDPNDPNEKGLVEDALEDAINPLIEDFNSNIAPDFLLNYPNDEPPVEDGLYVQWPYQSWLEMVDTVVDLLGECLPINDMLAIFIGDDGQLSLPLNFTTNVTVPDYADMTIGLTFANASGLNTFSEFDVMEYNVVNRYSLTEKLDLDNFAIALGISIGLEPLQQLEGSIPLDQKFVVGMAVSQLRTNIVNFLAVRADDVKTLHVEQLLDEPMCLMGGLYSANFTDLGVSISLDDFNMQPAQDLDEAALESQIDDFVNVFANVMLDDFQPWVSDFITGTLQGPVKKLVNTELNKLVNSADTTCPGHVEWTSDQYEFLEFDNIVDIMFGGEEEDGEGGSGGGTDIASLIDQDLVDRVLDGFLSPSGINNFADCMVQEVVGGLGSGNENGDVVDISPLEGLRVQVKDVFVEGMDSFYALNFSLVDPYTMNMGVGLGSPDNQFKFGMKVIIKFGEAHDEMDISFAFSDLEVLLKLMMKMEVAPLMNFRLEQLMINGCLASAMNEVGLKDLQISMGDVEVDIKTVTNSGSTRWLYGGTMVSELLNKIFKAIFVGIVPVANDMVTTLLEGSAETCANGGVAIDDGSAADVGLPSALGWVSFVTLNNLLGLGVFGILVYLYRYRSHSKARKRKLKLAEKAIEAGNFDDAENLLSGMKGPTDWSTALMFHPDISPWMRYGVPVVQFFLLILFVVANLQPGASVDLYLKIAQDPIVIPDLFLFTLAGTISDMLNAGVYFLAIVIILFSGCYPYCKVMTQLVCWVLPTSKLSAKRRESILLFVGAIGKWSLVDTFVLFLMMVAFNMRIALQEGDIKADVFIVTKFGFYGFLFATMASLSMGSVVLWFHRYTTDYVELEEGGPMISLSDMNHRYGKLLVRSTKRGRWAVTIMLTLTAVVCVWGSIIPSFRFNIEGLAGMALELTPNVNPETTYSLISLGLALPYATIDPNDVMLRWCQATYFVFSLVCPLLYLLGLWMLWCKPMTAISQRTWFVMTEVFSEWAAMEVFVISIVACSAQIGQLAYFMVGGACDEIDVIMAEAMKVDREIRNFVTEPTCFGVAAYLEPGAYFLTMGCIVFTIVGRYLQDFCHRGLEARLHESATAREERAMSRRLSEAGGRKTGVRFEDEDDVDKHVHEEERMGVLNRNLFALMSYLDMLEVINPERNSERITLGFGLGGVDLEGEEEEGLRGGSISPRSRQYSPNLNPIHERESAEVGGEGVEMEQRRTSVARQVVTRLNSKLSEAEEKGEKGAEPMPTMKPNIANCALNALNCVALAKALEEDLGIPQYKEAFMAEGIDGPVLCALAFDAEMLDDCLKDELGVSSALHRGKIKAFIATKMMQFSESKKSE